MSRPRKSPDGPQEHRTRIALTALTGFLSGITRAITDWLLSRLNG